jgi:hypothetical protein
MEKDLVGLPYVRLAFCFEDSTIGRCFHTIGRTVTEADILSVIKRTGMAEVLFMNLDFRIRASDISRRAAPGAFGNTFADGSPMQATMQHTGFAFVGTDQRTENPLFGSDTIHVEVKVIAAQLSPSRRGDVCTGDPGVGTTAPWLSPTRLCAWSSAVAPAGPQA